MNLSSVPPEIMNFVIADHRIYRSLSLVSKRFRDICYSFKKSKMKESLCFCIMLTELGIEIERYFILPNGKKHGENVQTSEKGFVTHFNYCNGVLNGVSTVLYKNIARILCHYVEGLLSGSYTEYNDEGVVMKLSHYKNGLLEGEIRRWNDKGDITYVCNYVDNEKHGLEITHLESGRMEQNYVKGRREGFFKTYKEKDLVEECYYENGIKHGLETCYYTSNRKRSEVNWVKGRREGFYKRYYKSGELKSWINYKNNLKDGMDTVLRLDGSFLRTKDFKRNKANGYEKYYNTLDEIVKEIYWYRDTRMS